MILGDARWAMLLVGSLVAPGCTWSAGDWFANLAPTFEARYVVRADRDVGGGWQKLNTLYQVRMSRLLLTIDDVQLRDGGGGGGGLAAFDPANPPPGYSLCHNGHCHRDDGALIPYDEIVAEGSGNATATARTVVTLPVGEADLLTPARRALTCQEGCGLPEAQIQSARATIARVEMEGFVREGRLPARLEGEVSWRAVLATGPGQESIHLDCPAQVPADNAHPPNVQLDLTLQLGARLLDGIDWAALATDTSGIDLSDPANAAARELLLENLAEGELSAAIKRE